MPTQSLPAASLRTADRLPAARVLVQVASYLIYKVLWPLRKASSGAESSFLPALREVWGGGSRSAGQTLGAGGDLRGTNLCDADLSGAGIIDESVLGTLMLPGTCRPPSYQGSDGTRGRQWPRHAEPDC
jgi:hypothetical protein